MQSFPSRKIADSIARNPQQVHSGGSMLQFDQFAAVKNVAVGSCFSGLWMDSIGSEGPIHMREVETNGPAAERTNEIVSSRLGERPLPLGQVGAFERLH